jgi:hypothetical protein
MDPHSAKKNGGATIERSDLFRDLRKHNERRARIAQLGEARTARRLTVERATQAQRERRLRRP